MVDPINTLLDTLAKLRLEIADVKSRQITSNQLDEFYAIMKETIKTVKLVEEAAYQGSRESSSRIEHLIKTMTQSNEYSIQKAVHRLDSARQETTEAAKQSLWQQKRIVRLAILFSALLGLSLGAWLGVLIANYFNT